MSELRSVLEREAEGISPPSFGIDELRLRRDRRARRRRVTAAVTALALFGGTLAGILWTMRPWIDGSGSKPASRPEVPMTTAREVFIDAYDESCGVAATKLSFLGPGQPTDFSPGTVRKFRIGEPIYADLVVALRAIDPPAGEEARVEALVRGWERVADKIAEAVAAADAGKGQLFHRRALRFFSLLNRAIEAGHDYGASCP